MTYANIGDNDDYSEYSLLNVTFSIFSRFWMLSLFTDISHTWIVFLTQNPSAFVHTVGYFWSALEPSEDRMKLNQSVMVWHHWYVPSRHGMRVCSMTVRRVPQYILLSSIGLHDTWWSRVPATARDRGESQRPKKVDFDIYSIHCWK